MQSASHVEMERKFECDCIAWSDPRVVKVHNAFKQKLGEARSRFELSLTALRYVNGTFKCDRQIMDIYSIIMVYSNIMVDYANSYFYEHVRRNGT